MIALYTVLTKPGKFGRLLIESPSLYVADARIITQSRSAKGWPSRVYVGVGTNEGGVANCKPGDPDREAVTDVRKLEEIIRSAAKVQLKTVIEDCAVHNEAAWAKRLPTALTFLFGRQRKGK